MNKVAIIIPNWNGLDVLPDCLESVKSIEGVGIRAIMVDNGSKDGSVNYVKQNFGNTQVIENRKNLGFAAACNIGIRAAAEQGFGLYLLLNNDTVVTKDFLLKMIKAAESEGAGIVGCRINYFNSDKVWFAGADFIKWRVSGKHRGQGRRENGFKGIEDSDYITGCCMLIKRKVVEKIGYFYEPYFLLIEDLDFCRRARQAGFKVMVNLEAVIYHKVSHSRQGEHSFSDGYYGARNRLIFAFKRSKNFLGGFIFLLMVFPLRFLKAILSGKKDFALGLTTGVKDFRGGKTGKLNI